MMEIPSRPGILEVFRKCSPSVTTSYKMWQGEFPYTILGLK